MPLDGVSMRELSWIGACGIHPSRTQYASNAANVLTSISLIHLHAET